MMIAQPKVHQPDEELMQITGKDHLSWSQVTLFRSCPRKWVFEYVEQVQPSCVSASLVFGSAIHSALEHYFEQWMVGEVIGIDALTEIFRASWQQELKDRTVIYPARQDEQALHEQCDLMLGAFMESDVSKPQGESIAIEEMLVGQLSERLPTFVARVDLIVQTEEGYRLIDFKTARSKWSEEQLKQSRDQLALYDSLAKQRFAEEHFEQQFIVLTKQKKPQLQIMTPGRIPSSGCASDSSGSNTPDVATIHLTQLIQPIWQAMQQGVDYANPSPMNCAGCGFKDRCPAVAG